MVVCASPDPVTQQQQQRQQDEHDEGSDLSSITHEHPATAGTVPTSTGDTFQDEYSPHTPPEGSLLEQQQQQQQQQAEHPPLPTEVLLPKERLAVVGISRTRYREEPVSTYYLRRRKARASGRYLLLCAPSGAGAATRTPVLARRSTAAA